MSAVTRLMPGGRLKTCLLLRLSVLLLAVLQEVLETLAKMHLIPFPLGLPRPLAVFKGGYF